MHYQTEANTFHPLLFWIYFMINSVKGTQDFLDLFLFKTIINKASSHCELYHYHEIATPIIEHTELFKRSLGIHTDVISKEMFTIEPRSEESNSISLRPEATASTMRAYLNNGIQQNPWKVFSWGPMFRYERPQKGRFRQFHQFNIENIGSSSILSDVELIAMLDKLFSHTLGLTEYALAINFLGCSADRAAHKIVLKEFLDANSTKICPTCLARKDTNIMRVFDCKSEACQEVYTKAPKTIDHLCAECASEWQLLQDNLSMLSVSHSVLPTLVRGLDYYTKTVFEFSSSALGAQSAFCGGGRYDHLAEMLNSKKVVPSVGAGIGIERLIAIVEAEKTITKPQETCFVVIAPLTDAQKTLALLMGDNLRRNNIKTHIILDTTSVKSMMRKADSLQATHTILVGETEQNTQQVMLKNMHSGEEKTVAIAKLAQELLKS